MRVASIGECMIELRQRPDGLLSQGFGGDTLNTAVYLARLGIAVDYVTALGDDAFSDAMLAAWQQEGIGTRQVARVPGALPGLYLIQVDSKGERRFSYWRDSAPVRRLLALPEAAGIAAALGGYDLLYLSGITLSLFPGSQRQQLFDWLGTARQRGARIAFDTNFRPRGWPDRDEARDAFNQMLRLSDIVLAGIEDYGQLSGDDSQAGCTAWLQRHGVAEAVLKLAVPGVVVLAQGTATPVPTTPVAHPVDSTAAGDSFAAAYLAARLRNLAPEQAARAGHRLAHAVVQHPGAIIPQDAMPQGILPPDWKP